MCNGDLLACMVCDEKTIYVLYILFCREKALFFWFLSRLFGVWFFQFECDSARCRFFGIYLLWCSLRFLYL